MTNPDSIPVLPRRSFSLDPAAANDATFRDLEAAPGTSTPDARLIRICGELVDVEQQLGRLYEAKRMTPAQERRTGALLAAANAREGFERRILAALICDLLEMPSRLPDDNCLKSEGETTGSAISGRRPSLLETAIAAAFAHALELGERDVAAELATSLGLARSKRLS